MSYFSWGTATIEENRQTHDDMVKIIYHQYIDDVINCPYSNIILKRFPDVGYMTIYMLDNISQLDMNNYLISIYIKKCDEKISVYFQNKIYEIDIHKMSQIIIYGPDTNLLSHFRNKPICIIT